MCSGFNGLEAILPALKLCKDGHQPEGNPLALPRVKLTKSAQVHTCGNNVCPPMARALIPANFIHERETARVA
jgi:DNA (cytosine-5)-methyltransferase 1